MINQVAFLSQICEGTSNAKSIELMLDLSLNFTKHSHFKRPKSLALRLFVSVPEKSKVWADVFHSFVIRLEFELASNAAISFFLLYFLWEFNCSKALLSNWILPCRLCLNCEMIFEKNASQLHVSAIRLYLYCIHIMYWYRHFQNYSTERIALGTKVGVCNSEIVLLNRMKEQQRSDLCGVETFTSQQKIYPLLRGPRSFGWPLVSPLPRCPKSASNLRNFAKSLTRSVLVRQSVAPRPRDQTATFELHIKRIFLHVYDWFVTFAMSVDDIVKL
jgi:hypothetical protein